MVLIASAIALVFGYLDQSFAPDRRTHSDRPPAGKDAIAAGILFRNSHQMAHETTDRKPQAVHRPLPTTVAASRAGLLRLAPSQQLSVSQCLHLMLLFGTQARVSRQDHPDEVKVIDIVTDDRFAGDFLPSACFVTTTFGVRFVAPMSPGVGDSRGSEAHRDQVLATFGVLGIPLTQRIMIKGAAHELKEALADSISAFHSAQNELSWTAIAYLSYVLPRTDWKNRFGDIYSFDDIAIALLQADLRVSSCGGTHVLQALARLLAVSREDEDEGVLNAQVAHSIESRLRGFVDAAECSQLPDGSWGADWQVSVFGHLSNELIETRHAASVKVLMTGHMVEWFNMLPCSLQPTELTTTRVREWLRSWAESARNENYWDEFCPYTHAFLAAAW